ncbi:MAG TPA: outer membrane beta-barrel protein [Candidatus Aminicenantes bacterium]|nr:outer membrane beta-barrel protein [Candidatus Aminicenantes bacterium]
MRGKQLSVKFLVVGALVLGALAWAVPAMAGEKGARVVPPGFLIDKDAFSVAGPQSDPAGSSAFSKLSLRLYGGYNYMMAGDVNEGADYYFELVEAYAAQSSGTVTGGYKPLHGGYNFGADLIYQITPLLGVGVGAGFMRSSADSLATYTREEFTVDIVSEAMLSAIPLRLGLFLDVPMGGKLSLTANAGAAYYLNLKFKGTQGLDFADGSWSRMGVEGAERSGADIGFHGGLGLEYKISPKLGVFVEAVGRYAKLKNFAAVTGTYENSDGDRDTTSGKLYLYTQSFGAYEISGFEISDTPPPPEVNVREPKFDLGGFSLQAGFRVRF